MRPWRNHYHVMFSPYGQWLLGDPRGWRERHHREHCEGDYRNPPAPSEAQRKKFEYSQQLMKRPPVELLGDAQRVACHALMEKLQRDEIEVLAFAVGRIHAHGIIRCSDHNPRLWIGRAKKHAAFTLVNAGLAERGGVWGKRSLCKPIENERHFQRAVDYVRQHVDEGAVVWSADDIFPTQVSETPTTPTHCHGWAFDVINSYEDKTTMNDNPTITDTQIHDVIKQHWGFDALRPLQLDAIRAGIEQRDSLVVLPTGGGKSLCYQVPPLVADRLDVVVSPLISLMRDQVDALRQNGYPAAAIHSSLTPDERDEIRRGMRDGAYRLLFISPERLVNPRFMEYLQSQNIRAFAIDEAHCISQWGHDFRPEYRQLELIRQRFPGASVHAYTATATERVRADIVERLSLADPNILVGTFDRPNLTYRVIPTVDVEAQILGVLSRHRDEAVIIYCLSRKDTENMAEFLTANGVNAAAYHAGMEAARRSAVQDAFAREQLDVVCATVAFGMGIDRSNVRCVIHASMPKSIEHYQQETGRAGRDGLEAECVLFYSGGDVMRWDRLIHKSAANADNPATIIEAGLELLNHMASICTSAKCRHRALSEYFGQSYDNPDCGACDVCLREIEIMDDSTTIAQKVLSCVARLEQSFGVKHVVDVLRGANTEAVRQRGHESLSTYGIMADWNGKALTQIVYQLVDLGVMERTAGDRPVVQLTGESAAVLRGDREVRLVKPAATLRETRAQTESWEGVDRGLFEHLRELRKQFAAERSVPAFVIFGDATLRDLARRRPTTPAAMRNIHGVGEKKLADFGEPFSDAIGEYCKANDVESDQDAPAGVIETNDIVRPKKTKTRPNPGKNRAMEMLRSGDAVADVARATERAESTVWGYLHELLAEEPAVDLSNWVDDATRNRVIEASTQMDDRRLRPLFEALHEEVPYEIIRAVLVHAELQHTS